jgi:hypothetical protein
MHCAIAEFSAFLVQFFDGPIEDAQRRWWLSLRESHSRFRITEEHRAAWMGHMIAALEETGLGELRGFFEHSSAYILRREHSGDELTPDIARRWERQLVVDGTIEAVRAGDLKRAVELAGQLKEELIFPALLDRFIRGGNAALIDYACGEVRARTELVHERLNNRRTLLHGAAASGCLPVVDLLLSLGADPQSVDGGGHTPLYSVANECGSDGSDVVEALVRAGADVNACGGVKRCTPLHMAARRGNVAIAQALLACGADRHARDSQGVTPLQRALNCRKPGVAELLRR